MALNKEDMLPCPHGVCILVREKDNKEEKSAECRAHQVIPQGVAGGLEV